MKNPVLSVNCRGQLVEFDRPRVMGILNLTPDSFFSGSRVAGEKELLRRAEKMLDDGADFLDLGGYSSRPGAEHIDEETERKRVIPAIETLQKNFPGVKISVDTFRLAVAVAALEAGACMVNDISGGNMDSRMFETVARYQVPYVLMHMQGTPQTMQENPRYDDPVTEINKFFASKIKELRALGLNDIILDPGFGFGKTLEHNYQILSRFEQFTWHGLPVLAGISRKSMLFRLLEGKPDEMLNATTAAHMIALTKGASVLRVHDVKPAMEAVRIFMATEQQKMPQS